MMMGVYTIRDIKSDFGTPFFAPNDACAGRMMAAAAQPDSMLTAYPQDFELWRLGHYETETGTIVPEMEEITSAAKSPTMV